MVSNSLQMIKEVSVM